MRFCKTIIGVLFISIFMTNEMSKPLLWVDYSINLEKYKQACINKAKTQMKCNGKCQVMKKMHNNKESKNTDAPPQKPKTEEHVLSSKSFFPFIKSISTFSNSIYSSQIKSYSFLYFSTFFQPPQA